MCVTYSWLWWILPSYIYYICHALLYWQFNSWCRELSRKVYSLRTVRQLYSTFVQSWSVYLHGESWPQKIPVFTEFTNKFTAHQSNTLGTNRMRQLYYIFSRHSSQYNTINKYNWLCLPQVCFVCLRVYKYLYGWRSIKCGKRSVRTQLDMLCTCDDDGVLSKYYMYTYLCRSSLVGIDKRITRNGSVHECLAVPNVMSAHFSSFPGLTVAQQESHKSYKYWRLVCSYNAHCCVVFFRWVLGNEYSWVAPHEPPPFPIANHNGTTFRNRRLADIHRRIRTYSLRIDIDKRSEDATQPSPIMCVCCLLPHR